MDSMTLFPITGVWLIDYIYTYVAVKAPWLFIGIILLIGFLPILISGGYLYHLYRKFILSEKINKKRSPIKNEKQKIWFYNLWLPSIIYILGYIFVWYTSRNYGDFGLTFLGVGFMFFLYYPIYHFLYFLAVGYSKFMGKISCEYRGGKISLMIFLIFTAIDIIGFLGWLCLVPW